MKIKESKSFFHFIFDKKTPKLQIRFILINAAPIHLKSIIEIVYNLLENKTIKIPLAVTKVIKENKQILTKFTSSAKKNLSIAQRVLKKYFRLIFFILQKSKTLIFQIIDQ